jgi:hypothetical protein
MGIRMRCLLLIMLACQQHVWSFVDQAGQSVPPTATDRNISPADPLVQLPEGYTVHFWSTVGCGPCRQFKANQKPKLGKQCYEFELAKHRDEARRLKITRFPTIQIVQGGYVRHTYVGNVSAETIRTKCKQLAAPRLSYQRRSARRWNVNGDLSPTREEVISHLTSAHRQALNAVPPDQLRRFTLGELLAIHDDAHNGALP